MLSGETELASRQADLLPFIMTGTSGLGVGIHRGSLLIILIVVARGWQMSDPRPSRACPCCIGTGMVKREAAEGGGVFYTSDCPKCEGSGGVPIDDGISDRRLLIQELLEGAEACRRVAESITACRVVSGADVVNLRHAYSCIRNALSEFKGRK